MNTFEELVDNVTRNKILEAIAAYSDTPPLPKFTVPENSHTHALDNAVNAKLEEMRELFNHIPVMAESNPFWLGHGDNPNAIWVAQNADNGYLDLLCIQPMELHKRVYPKAPVPTTKDGDNGPEIDFQGRGITYNSDMLGYQNAIDGMHFDMSGGLKDLHTRVTPGFSRQDDWLYTRLKEMTGGTDESFFDKWTRGAVSTAVFTPEMLARAQIDVEPIVMERQLGGYTYAPAVMELVKKLDVNNVVKNVYLSTEDGHSSDKFEMDEARVATVSLPMNLTVIMTYDSKGNVPFSVVGLTFVDGKLPDPRVAEEEFKMEEIAYDTKLAMDEADIVPDPIHTTQLSDGRTLIAAAPLVRRVQPLFDDCELSKMCIVNDKGDVSENIDMELGSVATDTIPPNPSGLMAMGADGAAIFAIMNLTFEGLQTNTMQVGGLLDSNNPLDPGTISVSSTAFSTKPCIKTLAKGIRELRDAIKDDTHRTIPVRELERACADLNHRTKQLDDFSELMAELHNSTANVPLMEFSYNAKDHQLMVRTSNPAVHSEPVSDMDSLNALVDSMNGQLREQILTRLCSVSLKISMQPVEGIEKVPDSEIESDLEYINTHIHLLRDSQKTEILGLPDNAKGIRLKWDRENHKLDVEFHSTVTRTVGTFKIVSERSNEAD